MRILKSAETTGDSAEIKNTGDGNRTRVSCLGSTRPTIERRPHVVRADSSVRLELCQVKIEKNEN